MKKKEEVEIKNELIEAVKSKRTFTDIGIQDALVKAVTELGYTHATEIQERSIPVLISGTKDFIGLAQTGTGKTAAFGLPLLQLINTADRFPQALVVCPTRELCIQIVNEMNLFKKHMPGVQVLAVYGGASIGVQIRDLKRGVQIVVATPGRLIDLIERKAINLEKIEYVVLDEADEMLSKGFKEQVQNIFSYLPEECQIALFSATMPVEILQMTSEFMRHPTRILVKTENLTLDGISQFYVSLENEEQKFLVLSDIYETVSVSQGIIFVNSKQKSEELRERLEKKNYTVGLIHGGYNQYERNDIELLSGRFRVKGDTIDIIPGYDRDILRIELSGNKIDKITILENKYTGDIAVLERNLKITQKKLDNAIGAFKHDKSIILKAIEYLDGSN